MEGAEEMGTLLKRTDSKISANKKQKNITISIIMICLSVAMIFPFIFMLSTALKTNVDFLTNPTGLIPEKFYFENFNKIFAHNYYLVWYWNTVKIVGSTMILRLFVVTFAAYAFAKLNFRGKNIMFFLAFALWMVPNDTTVVGRYLFYKYINLVDTPWAIILPYTFDVFVLFMMRQFFMKIPESLTESATIDGASYFQIYYKIMMPLAKPAIMTMLLFTFIWTWNSYADPFVFISTINKQMITVGLQFFQAEMGANIPMQLAGASLGIFLPLILYGFAQKYFVEGIAMSGIKG